LYELLVLSCGVLHPCSWSAVKAKGLGTWMYSICHASLAPFDGNGCCPGAELRVPVAISVDRSPLMT
jgi:hypothetical protein